MLRLEIKHLRLVAAIAETANLTRAAQALCLSQPALSKQLAELEERLGFALFYRTKRAMILTEPGALLDTQARLILGQVAELESQLHQYAKGDSGKLRISIDRVHQADWLPAVMKQFRMRYPQIELVLKPVPDLLCSLQQREIDVAVIGEVIEAAGVDYVALNEDEMVAVLPLDHPLCQQVYVSVADLGGLDLLYYFELEQSYLYRRHLYPNQISLGSFHHIQNIDAIIELVTAGEGVSILPRRLLSEALCRQQLAVRPIGEGGFAFRWYAALTPQADKPYVVGFIELLQGAIVEQRKGE
ncbi:LysR family transcriptional regulator [Pseudomonas sp. 2FE]|uniref:LysR family transcriptional regulator n=1 Tax=Pseudomonas sp. 2FE TaxID=2502190 RepID=UPI0014858DF8|nr:LysR family transcriptional regulator [Pseudomonas sp. 2FE]